MAVTQMKVTINRLLLVAYMDVYPVVNGCGLIQATQEKTLNFTLTDFKLPAIMAFSESPAARTKTATISTSRSDAETFVKQLIIRSVEDVLYQQGRATFLSDNVIALILQQIDIQISYNALQYDNVIDLSAMVGIGMMMNCVVVDGSVTSICTGNAAPACTPMAMVLANSKPIDPKHLSISGTLKTNNIVMANWSDQMWRSVLNRVPRSITSGSYGSYFSGASVNLKLFTLFRIYYIQHKRAVRW